MSKAVASTALPPDKRARFMTIGYALAGLWLAAAFMVIGVGLSAVLITGYLWSGVAFRLVQAGVTGFGFILCGLCMRQA